jgi:steroid 5-alpha reductase family enzyme
MPVIILNSPAIMNTGSTKFGTARDIVGVIFWAIGFSFEALADQTKYMFKKRHPKSFCDAGVWKVSRHPNYFGEIFSWWGIWMLCLSPSTNGPVSGGAYGAQYGAIVSPLFITLLLLFVSGLTLQEPPAQKKMYNSDQRDAHRKYLDQTSILIPLPPALYRPMPLWLKRTVLFDFPFYQYDPAKDKDQKDDQAERGEAQSHRRSERSSTSS